MTYDSLKQTLLELMDVAEEDFDPDGNLIDFGLDSIQVFDLIGQFQELGVQVDFVMLAEEPTLNGWWRLIAPQLGDSP